MNHSKIKSVSLHISLGANFLNAQNREKALALILVSTLALVLALTRILPFGLVLALTLASIRKQKSTGEQPKCTSITLRIERSPSVEKGISEWVLKFPAKNSE